MSKGFDLAFIENLKGANNIVDIIAKYVSVEKKGNSYWARCPFHHEKTPSFSINESGQYYHCFGCGVGGDVITFIRAIEALDYVEAVKYLAERANITLPDIDINDEKIHLQRQKKEKLLALLTDTAKYYVKNLNSGSCEKHIEYIISRGISSTTVRKFGIGASADYESLPIHLTNMGYTKEEILEAGVCESKDNYMYDSLGKRLIFPIINAFGDVIAFGGRVMESTNFAKYKNTKETQLFYKSKNLYNLNLLKKEKQMAGLTNIIIVEGYMDTIALYQAGFTNVVASMGTALTKDQARLLKRYSENVVISFDGDSAGAKATIRGLEILESENINVKVISLPDQMDPDDVIKKGGKDAYKTLVDNSLPLDDYKISIVKKNYDLSKIDEKRKYVQEILSIIKTVKSATLQEEYLKNLRDITDINFESLKRDLESLPIKAEEKEQGTIILQKSDALMKAKRFILASILAGKRYADEFDIKTIKFDNNVHNHIVNYIISTKNENKAIKISMLFEILSEESQDELNSILSFCLDDFINGENARKFFKDSIYLIKKENIEETIYKLNKEYEKQEDLNKRREIVTKISQLMIEKNTLN